MNQQYIKLADIFRTGKSVEIEALVGSVGITTGDNFFGTSCNISYDDARKLVEMLIKHTHPGQKLSLPMPVTAPMAHLIVGFSHDRCRGKFLNVSCLEAASVSAQALKREEPDRPVWLGYLTKEFIQPTPAYEWKDL